MGNTYNLLKFRKILLLLSVAFIGSCSKGITGPENKAIKQIPGMVYIGPGNAVIGTDASEEKDMSSSVGFRRKPYASEAPKHVVNVPGFYIDRYEVTFRQFKKFLDATHYPQPSLWRDSVDFEKLADYPVSAVTWNDADAFAKWAGKRLPTEIEWEKAARGKEGKRFVFGNAFDAAKAGLARKDIIPVSKAGFDKSPFGVIGMCGNISEWTESWYTAYQGNADKEKAYGKKYKVYRGGAWTLLNGHRLFPEYYFRAAFRGYALPDMGLGDVGFRCAKDAPR